MVINKVLEFTHSKDSVHTKLNILRFWVKHYIPSPYSILFDFTCFEPISTETKNKFWYNDDLQKILNFSNHYIWCKLDLELSCTNYVKRRIVNSKLEKEMLKGTITKEEFLLLIHNFESNIKSVEQALLDEKLPF